MKIKIIKYKNYKTLDEAKKLIPKGYRLLRTGELMEMIEAKDKELKKISYNYYYTSLGAVGLVDYVVRFHVLGYYNFDFYYRRSRGVLVVKEDKQDV
jgi:hypothetical protein